MGLRTIGAGALGAIINPRHPIDGATNWANKSRRKQIQNEADHANAVDAARREKLNENATKTPEIHGEVKNIRGETPDKFKKAFHELVRGTGGHSSAPLADPHILHRVITSNTFIEAIRTVAIETPLEEIDPRRRTEIRKARERLVGKWSNKEEGKLYDVRRKDSPKFDQVELEIIIVTLVGNADLWKTWTESLPNPVDAFFSFVQTQAIQQGAGNIGIYLIDVINDLLANSTFSTPPKHEVNRKLMDPRCAAEHMDALIGDIYHSAVNDFVHGAVGLLSESTVKGGLLDCPPTETGRLTGSAVTEFIADLERHNKVKRKLFETINVLSADQLANEAHLEAHRAYSAAVSSEESAKTNLENARAATIRAEAESINRAIEFVKSILKIVTVDNNKFTHKGDSEKTEKTQEQLKYLSVLLNKLNEAERIASLKQNDRIEAKKEVGLSSKIGIVGSANVSDRFDSGTLAAALTTFANDPKKNIVIDLSSNSYTLQKNGSYVEAVPVGAPAGHVAGIVGDAFVVDNRFDNAQLLSALAEFRSNLAKDTFVDRSGRSYQFKLNGSKVEVWSSDVSANIVFVPVANNKVESTALAAELASLDSGNPHSEFKDSKGIRYSLVIEGDAVSAVALPEKIGSLGKLNLLKNFNFAELTAGIEALRKNNSNIPIKLKTRQNCELRLAADQSVEIWLLEVAVPGTAADTQVMELFKPGELTAAVGSFLSNQSEKNITARSGRKCELRKDPLSNVVTVHAVEMNLGQLSNSRLESIFQISELFGVLLDLIDNEERPRKLKDARGLEYVIKKGYDEAIEIKLIEQSLGQVAKLNSANSTFDLDTLKAILKTDAPHTITDAAGLLYMVKKTRDATGSTQISFVPEQRLDDAYRSFISSYSKPVGLGSKSRIAKAIVREIETLKSYGETEVAAEREFEDAKKTLYNTTKEVGEKFADLHADLTEQAKEQKAKEFVDLLSVERDLRLKLEALVISITKNTALGRSLQNVQQVFEDAVLSSVSGELIKIESIPDSFGPNSGLLWANRPVVDLVASGERVVEQKKRFAAELATERISDKLDAVSAQLNIFGKKPLTELKADLVAALQLLEARELQANKFKNDQKKRALTDALKTFKSHVPEPAKGGLAVAAEPDTFAQSLQSLQTILQDTSALISKSFQDQSIKTEYGVVLANLGSITVELLARLRQVETSLSIAIDAAPGRDKETLKAVARHAMASGLTLIECLGPIHDNLEGIQKSLGTTSLETERAKYQAMIDKFESDVGSANISEEVKSSFAVVLASIKGVVSTSSSEKSVTVDPAEKLRDIKTQYGYPLEQVARKISGRFDVASVAQFTGGHQWVKRGNGRLVLRKTQPSITATWTVKDALQAWSIYRKAGDIQKMQLKDATYFQSRFPVLANFADISYWNTLRKFGRFVLGYVLTPFAWYAHLPFEFEQWKLRYRRNEKDIFSPMGQTLVTQVRNGKEETKREAVIDRRIWLAILHFTTEGAIYNALPSFDSMAGQIETMHRLTPGPPQNLAARESVDAARQRRADMWGFFINAEAPFLANLASDAYDVAPWRWGHIVSDVKHTFAPAIESGRASHWSAMLNAAAVQTKATGNPVSPMNVSLGLTQGPLSYLSGVFSAHSPAHVELLPQLSENTDTTEIPAGFRSWSYPEFKRYCNSVYHITDETQILWLHSNTPQSNVALQVLIDIHQGIRSDNTRILPNSVLNVPYDNYGQTLWTSVPTGVLDPTTHQPRTIDHHVSAPCVLMRTSGPVPSVISCNLVVSEYGAHVPFRINPNRVAEFMSDLRVQAEFGRSVTDILRHAAAEPYAVSNAEFHIIQNMGLTNPDTSKVLADFIQLNGGVTVQLIDHDADHPDSPVTLNLTLELALQKMLRHGRLSDYAIIDPNQAISWLREQANELAQTQLGTVFNPETTRIPSAIFSNVLSRMCMTSTDSEIVRGMRGANGSQAVADLLKALVLPSSLTTIDTNANTAHTNAASQLQTLRNNAATAATATAIDSAVTELTRNTSVDIARRNNFIATSAGTVSATGVVVDSTMLAQAQATIAEQAAAIVRSLPPEAPQILLIRDTSHIHELNIVGAMFNLDVSVQDPAATSPTPLHPEQYNAAQTLATTHPLREFLRPYAGTRGHNGYRLATIVDGETLKTDPVKLSQFLQALRTAHPAMPDAAVFRLDGPDSATTDGSQFRYYSDIRGFFEPIPSISSAAATTLVLPTRLNMTSTIGPTNSIALRSLSMTMTRPQVSAGHRLYLDVLASIPSDLNRTTNPFSASDTGLTAFHNVLYEATKIAVNSSRTPAASRREPTSAELRRVYAYFYMCATTSILSLQTPLRPLGISMRSPPVTNAADPSLTRVTVTGLAIPSTVGTNNKWVVFARNALLVSDSEIALGVRQAPATAPAR